MEPKLYWEETNCKYISTYVSISGVRAVKKMKAGMWTE